MEQWLWLRGTVEGAMARRLLYFVLLAADILVALAAGRGGGECAARGC